MRGLDSGRLRPDARAGVFAWRRSRPSLFVPVFRESRSQKAKCVRNEPIGPVLHSLIDWALAELCFGGPFLIADYPGGLAKRMHVRWHQLFEIISPLAFMVGPWTLFGNHPASWLLSVIGLVMLVNILSTRKLRIRG